MLNMATKEFVKIIIPYFIEQSIELYIQDDLCPTDLEMIRYKALNCLATEKERDEIILDMKQFLTLTGFTNVIVNPDDTNDNIIEVPILL